MFSMHAYLLVGKDSEAIENKVNFLIRQLSSVRHNLPLQKIVDVRELERFARLQLNKPTSIVADISNSTVAALNAFLKSLEEPQSMLSYILVVNSLQKVLPTIVSRCHVIKIQNIKTKKQNSDFAEKFLNKSKGKMLLELDTLKKRVEALEFLELLIASGHKNVEDSRYANALSSALVTLKNIQSNGNVTLQMANFVANI